MSQSAKVGVSYNLFDGEELLPYSIITIRDKVHHISVVYQTVSNLGKPANPDLEKKLKEMLEDGLIDELYLYRPILAVIPQINETKKRNIGLELAKKNGCDYFLSMDVDEFYDENQFEFALKYIFENDIAISAISIIDYFKTPEYQVSGIHTFVNGNIHNYYVPFLIKIDRSIRQSHASSYFPCFVDPTRRLYCPGKVMIFSVQQIAMHHMSTIRKDLFKKYQNTSYINRSMGCTEAIKSVEKKILEFNFDENTNLPRGFAIYEGKLIKKVENKFHIRIN